MESTFSRGRAIMSFGVPLIGGSNSTFGFISPFLPSPRREVVPNKILTLSSRREMGPKQILLPSARLGNGPKADPAEALLPSARLGNGAGKPSMSPLAAFEFAADVFFLDGLALVVFFLAFGKGDDEFGIAVVSDEELDGDDGEAFLLVGGPEVLELALGQEELAVARRFVLAPGAPEILGDVEAADVELAGKVKIAISILEGSLSATDGLDLRPDQHDAGRIGLEELVVERGPAVGHLYLVALGFRHCGDKDNDYFGTKAQLILLSNQTLCMSLRNSEGVFPVTDLNASWKLRNV